MLLAQLVDFHFKQHINGEREALRGRDGGRRTVTEDSGEVKVTRREEGGEKKRGYVRRGEVSQEGERRRRESSGR